MNERKTFIPGMMRKDTGDLGVLAGMIDHINDRGGMNHLIANKLRGKNKSFLGYGYRGQTRISNGVTFEHFPDRVYMLKGQTRIRIHPIDNDRVIVGRKNIKRYLEEQRKALRKAS